MSIGLYLEPPRHTVMSSASTRRQRFKRSTRSTRCCRCRQGKQNAMGFVLPPRHTVAVCAALDTHTGEVLGSAVPPHTSDAFRSIPRIESLTLAEA